MTEEIIKCVKGESCIHCGSTYCRFVDEVNELKQENKELSRLIRGTKDYVEVCSVCKDEVTIYPNISGRTDYTQNEVECRTLAQIITRKNNLEQENKELKKQHYETLKMLKHEYDGRQRDNEQWFTRCTENHNEDSKIIEKYRSALEEIKSIIINDNSMLVDKKDYIELQCGEPIAFKLQKIYNKINEVLNKK